MVHGVDGTGAAWGDNIPTTSNRDAGAATPTGAISWRYRRAWMKAARERFGDRPEVLGHFLKGRMDEAHKFR